MYLFVYFLNMKIYIYDEILLKIRSNNIGLYSYLIYLIFIQ